MEEFELAGNGGYIKIAIDYVFGFPDEIGYWGGYDVNANIDIKAGDFAVKSNMYMSTGDIFNFYTALSKSNQTLSGSVQLNNYEHNLRADINYDVNGQVSISGTFATHSEENNKLSFEFRSDQSYIQATLKQLALIVSKYGGLRGIEK